MRAPFLLQNVKQYIWTKSNTISILFDEFNVENYKTTWMLDIGCTDPVVVKVDPTAPPFHLHGSSTHDLIHPGQYASYGVT